MFDRRPVPPHIKAFAENLLSEVDTLKRELGPQAINYDHFQIKSLVEAAYMYNILSQILRELQHSNAREASKNLPFSILSPSNQGEE